MRERRTAWGREGEGGELGEERGRETGVEELLAGEKGGGRGEGKEG